MATTTAPAPAAEARPAGMGRRALVRVRAVFGAPTLNAALLSGTTLFLVAFGLIMVLSSSSVESYVADSSFFSSFSKQAAFAAIGLALMFIASRIPATFWPRIAWLAVAGGIALQSLVFVPGLGVEAGGNRNWIAVGGFSLQPSEFVKLALIVWMGLILTRKQRSVGKFWQAWIPIAPVAGAAILLVMLGHDFGTVVIMVMIVFGALWFAGVKWWHLILPVLLLAVLAVPVVLSSITRVRRIESFFRGCTNADYYSECWQQLHGTWALSAGGLFGVGLGNSKAKWNWLPAAADDYIFAIIGEELGLVGCIVVLVLFTLFAIGAFHVIRKTHDPFIRIVSGGITVWIVGQAIVNMGVVLRIFPVLGVPLPFMSQGGTSLLSVLVACGVLLSFARTLPARAAAPLAR